MKVRTTRRSIYLFFISFFLFWVLGCQEKETLLPEHRGGQIYQGKFRMDIKCFGCHGWLGEGSGHAPALANNGKIMSYFDFYSAVTFGRGGAMPAYQHVLTEKDLRLMMDWLQRVSVLRSVE